MCARKFIAAAVFLVFLGCSQAASAFAEVTPTWTPPIRLSALGQKATQPQIATVDGETVAVWLQLDGGNWIVQESSRPSEGSFSAPIDLSSPGSDASDPQLVLNRRGAAVVIWQSAKGADQVIQASTRQGERESFDADPGEHSFAGPVDLSAAEGSAGEPRVTISNGGEAMAAWESSNGSDDVVQMAELDPTTQAWSSPVSLSAPGQNAAEPAVGISYNGTAAVVWRRFNGSNQVVQAVTRKGRDSFSEPQDLSASGADASKPEVEVQEFGAVAAWESSEAGRDSIEESSWLETAGEFTEAAELGPAGPATDLRIDTEGKRITWFEGSVLDYRSQAGFGEFPAPTTTVQLPGEADQLNLAGSPDLIWRALSSEASIEALPAGAPEPVTVFAAGNSASEPAIAGYQWGPDLAAIWVRPEGADSSVEVSGLDAEGPSLAQQVFGPPSPVGVPISLWALTYDLWSPIVSIEWDLGDGSTANGEKVEHAFCAGTYSVRYTVTNALGQSSSGESRLEVEGSNAPKIGTFYEELGADGVASLKVAVPCPGGLSMDGEGLEPWRGRLSEAGTVSIPIVAAGAASEEIEKTGMATVEPQISFEPQGAPMESAATSVTLYGEQKPQPPPPYWSRCSTGSGAARDEFLVHAVPCKAAHRALASVARRLRETKRSSALNSGFECRLRRSARWKVECHRGRGRILAKSPESSLRQ